MKKLKAITGTIWLKLKELYQFVLKTRKVFKIINQTLIIIPNTINLKLSDFFNVFSVKIAAKAVIKNKKKGRKEASVNFDLNLSLYPAFKSSFYQLQGPRKTWYQNS